MKRATSIFLILLAACSTNQKPASPGGIPAPSGDARIAIGLQGDSLVMCEGGLPFAAASVTWSGDPAGAPKTVPAIKWQSGDASVVQVNSHSQLTGRSAGHTYIIGYVTWGDFAAQKSFPVLVRKGAIDVAASNIAGKLVCRTK